VPPVAMGLVLEGASDMARFFGGVHRRIEKALHDEMRQVVLIVAGRAKFHIRGSRKTNPPEMLGVVTGRLRQSITGRVEDRGGFIVGLVGPQRVKYAAIHELGGEISGPFGVKVDMPRRPYLAPALEETRELIVKRLGDAFESSLEVR